MSCINVSFTNRDRIVSCERCVITAPGLSCLVGQDGPDTDSHQIFTQTASLHSDTSLLAFTSFPVCCYTHPIISPWAVCCIYTHTRVFTPMPVKRIMQSERWISVCFWHVHVCIFLKQGKWFSCTYADHVSMKTAVIIRANRCTPVCDWLSIAITHGNSYEYKSEISLLLCTWCQRWLCTYVYLIVPYIPYHTVRQICFHGCWDDIIDLIIMNVTHLKSCSGCYVLHVCDCEWFELSVSIVQQWQFKDVCGLARTLQ